MRLRLPSLSADWAYTILLSMADSILLCTTSFRMIWRPEIMVLVSALLLAAIAQIYLRYRQTPRLGHMASTGCLLVMFTSSAAIFDYIMVGILPWPLWDRALDAMDKAMGLDWLGTYQWVVGQRLLYNAGVIVYSSLGIELLFLLLLLEALGCRPRAMELRYYFTTTALLTIFIGILMPAAGAFALYHLPVAQVTPCIVQVAALRDGSMRVINLANTQGLIAFPSFHAALAMLCAFAARSIKYIAVPLLILNLSIVLSSIPIGGHYFIDIFAGIAVSMAVILSERWKFSQKTLQTSAP